MPQPSLSNTHRLAHLRTMSWNLISKAGNPFVTKWCIAIQPMLVSWNLGSVVMLLTKIEPMFHAPMGTACILHNLSMSISTTALIMRQPIGCGAWHKPPDLVNPPQM